MARMETKEHGHLFQKNKRYTVEFINEGQEGTVYGIRGRWAYLPGKPRYPQKVRLTSLVQQYPKFVT